MTTFKEALWRNLWIFLTLLVVALSAKDAEADSSTGVAFIVASRALPLSRNMDSQYPIYSVYGFLQKDREKQGIAPWQGILCWWRGLSENQGQYQAFIAGFVKYAKDVPVAGFSGDWRGVIANDHIDFGLFKGGLGFAGERITMRGGAVKDISLDPSGKGQELAREMKGAAGKVLLVFTTADLGQKKGITTDFLIGVKTGMAGIPVVGGRLPARQFVSFGENVYDKDAAIGIVLGGRLTLAVKMASYMKKVNGPFKATKAAGRKVWELENRPAAEVYAQAVRALPWGLKNEALMRDYPLARKRGDDWIVCQQSVLNDDGSFEFEQPINSNEELYLVTRDPSAGLSRLEPMVKEALQETGQSPCGMMILDDTSHWFSPDKTREKTEIINKKTTVPKVGFFLDGEFLLNGSFQICGDAPALVLLAFGQE